MSKVEDMLQTLIEGGDIANYNPQSEIEVWLKKIILGESDETLPATSRLTKLLKVVANEGIVGGGGSSGTDTSSATALPSDVLKGKTFFNANGKQEGTIESYDGTFEGEATPNTVEQMLITFIENVTSYELFIIPEGTTIITDMVSGAKFKKVICPSTLTKISNYAFENCVVLETIDLSLCKSVPTLFLYAFKSCPALTEIKVPSALLDSFKSSTNWSSYANYMIGV